jgi:uncharacterized protein
MNLDLRDYENFPAEINLEYEADNADYGVEAVAFCDLMSLILSIQKVNDEYYCQGEVSVRVEQECARCLNLFESDLTGDLNFIVKSEKGKTVMASDSGEDVVFVNSAEPIIELNDLIRQSLSSSIPLKPLCSTECRGLCPNCGTNLNEDTCDCKEESYEERWEGLEGLVD